MHKVLGYREALAFGIGRNLFFYWRFLLSHLRLKDF